MSVFLSPRVIVTNDAVNGSFMREPPESGVSVLCVFDTRERWPSFNYANEGTRSVEKG